MELLRVTEQSDQQNLIETKKNLKDVKKFHSLMTANISLLAGSSPQLHQRAEN